MQAHSAAERVRAWLPSECILFNLDESIHVTSLHMILIFQVETICWHDEGNHILRLYRVSGGQLRSCEVTACSFFLCLTNMCTNVLAVFWDWVKVNFCISTLETNSWKSSHIWNPFPVFHCRRFWSWELDAYKLPLMCAHNGEKGDDSNT